ncbi:unnamed protein product [Oppiella nova]|uniref:Methyltransferase type 11 domain-containing protein n=1 Tax=Oppiella nova TaxID=334625 RepID=A0A7R9M0Z2_9ACAR|nr:unnamed protein product [Oppiella nova]CAG2168639.1 unnamed protein product [Oppiella nova]
MCAESKLWGEVRRYMRAKSGCKGGQGTSQLSQHFHRCYGFDVSAAQIQEAKASHHEDNTRYEVCGAESMPSIASNSVQLVTAFESAQYFVWNSFVDECTRVLVDGAVVAVIGYWLPDPIDPSHPSDRSLIDLMDSCYNDTRLTPYKSPKATIQLVVDHYRDVKFPSNYEFLHIDNIVGPQTVVAHDMVGLVESWSAYQALRRADKDTADSMSRDISDKLMDILKTTDLSAKEIVFNYTYFIAMARKLHN